MDETTKPTGPDQPKTAAEYFNPDTEAKMREMTETEMFTLMRNLEQSEVWIALLKYNQSRLSFTQSALFAGDPVKDATGMARNQGIMLGISDFQNAVIMLAQEYEEAHKGTEVE